ncbi:MAG: hypothetical protein NC823_02550 [Candidatus Omnitrophica bacterium]|nr:hypothetical protein [Candidatus Omnitrophota bacterium]
MLKGKMVKIRFRRYYAEQRLWVFIGKVLDFTGDWITVEGKGIIVVKGDVHSPIADEKPRILMIPRDNIAHVRVLPDNFDINRLEFYTRGVRHFIRVPGAPETSIGEI